MNFELLHPREQIVQIINRIYHGEMTTLSGGNLSIKDYVGNIRHVLYVIQLIDCYIFYAKSKPVYIIVPHFHHCK